MTKWSIKSFNLMNSLICGVPRNAKTLKCIFLAGEGIELMMNQVSGDSGWNGQKGPSRREDGQRSR
jgi:hypothetical protein